MANEKGLGPRDIQTLPVGTHRIAPNLYAQVDEAGRRTLLFRWSQGGKAQNKTLGRWAKEQHLHFMAVAERGSQALVDGRDPRLALEASRGDAAVGSFKEAAEAFMAENLPAMKSRKIRDAYRRSLEKTYPAIGHLTVRQITADHVAKVLRKDWLRTPKSARVLRYRIGAVLNCGFARAEIDRKNPADFDRLRHLLPRQPERAIEHRQALPHAKVAACWRELEQKRLWSNDALRFVILTAVRSTEARCMTWDEVDFDAKVWIIPAARMKTGKQHRVPLSDEALSLLRRAEEIKRGRYVFQGGKDGKPLSENVLQNALGRTAFEADVHGFRTTFKDWCRETKMRVYDWELVELCIAHDLGSEAANAYKRSDCLELRRPMMQEWASYVTSHRRLALAA